MLGLIVVITPAFAAAAAAPTTNGSAAIEWMSVTKLSVRLVVARARGPLRGAGRSVHARAAWPHASHRGDPRGNRAPVLHQVLGKLGGRHWHLRGDRVRRRDRRDARLPQLCGEHRSHGVDLRADRGPSSRGRYLARARRRIRLGAASLTRRSPRAAAWGCHGGREPQRRGDCGGRLHLPRQGPYRRRRCGSGHRPARRSRARLCAGSLRAEHFGVDARLDDRPGLLRWRGQRVFAKRNIGRRCARLPHFWRLANNFGRLDCRGSARSRGRSPRSLGLACTAAWLRQLRNCQPSASRLE